MLAQSERHAPRERDKIAVKMLCKIAKKKGYRLKAVSAHVDISYQQLQKYTSGKNRMSVGIFLDICDYIEVKPSDILDAVTL